jgi:hypothetical protein
MPPKKNRWVGRTCRGSKDWKKQMEAQDVPIAPVVKVVYRRIRAASELREAIGEE